MEDNVALVTMNKRLRKETDQPKKIITERKQKNHLFRSAYVPVKTKKEKATPMSFAGFPTCLSFLRIPMDFSETAYKTPRQ